MRDLVRHLIKCNFDEIVEKSLLNCHAYGLHSVMLLDHPNTKIRMFVTDESHQLHKNVPGEMRNGMEIAFHPHHCDLMFHVIEGDLFNWIVEPKYIGGAGGLYLDKYIYQSAITQGVGKFIPLMTKVPLRTISAKWHPEGKGFEMKAHEIHTVAVAYKEIAAWLVVEGKEDANYNPFAYSNSRLDKQSFDGLYIKPTRGKIEFLLDRLNLWRPDSRSTRNPGFSINSKRNW